MADKFDVSEFSSVMEQLIEVVDKFRLTMTGASQDEIDRAEQERLGHTMMRDAQKKNTKATDENTTAKKASSIALKGLKDMVLAAGREFVNVGREGIKFAEAIGVSATRGVQLEIDNRQAVAAQLGSFNTDLQVTMEVLKSAQQGFADVFTGAAAGMQISADGSAAFARSLQAGFGSEFKATGETFRILTQMGMSTTEQFDAFRKSTGRATLSNNQLITLYNKNRLSFLLYGNSFSRAAANAEKLGINLASIQGAQEGLVTNLDGTIDTVAQINQLGGQIDFGNLVRIAEEEGPDALLAYVRATVPEQLMQSASTRALFKQLGISVEDYMQSGKKQQTAADDLERQMTQTATATGTAAVAAAMLARKDQLMIDVFGELYTTTKQVIGALIGLAISAAAAAAATLAKSLLPGGAPFLGPAGGPGMGMAARLGLGGAGVAVTAGGVALGASQVEQGNKKTGFGLGAIGGIGGALLTATAILGAVPTGGASLALLGLAGLAGGSAALAIGSSARRKKAEQLNIPYEKLPEYEEDQRKRGYATLEEYVAARNANALRPQVANDLYSPPVSANDMYSPGYGNRVLVTPTKAFALNNADDIIAGTRLFPKDTLSMAPGAQNAQNSDALQKSTMDLIRKVQTLVDTLSNATTTVNINNTTQAVPRMQLVGVYSRNEVR